MRKFLIALGVVFALIIAGAGFMFAVLKLEGPGLVAESQLYVDATLPQVLTDPSAEKLLRFWPPQRRETLPTSGAEKLVEYINEKFGAFQGADRAELQGYKIDYSPSGRTVTARYTALCRFRQGATTATIVVEKTGAEWGLARLTFSMDLKPIANGGGDPT